jgi:hypothetical protein
MTAKYLIGIVLLVCLLTVGTIVFTQSSQSKDGSLSEATKQSSNSETVREKDVFTQKGTIVELLALGKPIACSYTQNEVGAKLTGSGTVYLDGLNRFRIDALQNRDGQEFQSNLIYTETLMHMWVTGQGRTFATTLPVERPITTLDETNKAALNTTMVYENVIYTCNAWVVDESVFTPPTDIAFTDIRSMFPKDH